MLTLMAVPFWKRLVSCSAVMVASSAESVLTWRDTSAVLARGVPCVDSTCSKPWHIGEIRGETEHHVPIKFTMPTDTYSTHGCSRSWLCFMMHMQQ